jgi:hypothetical protein
MDNRHNDFIMWFDQCLLHIVVTSFGQGFTQPLSNDPNIKPEYHGFLPYIKFRL